MPDKPDAICSRIATLDILSKQMRVAMNLELVPIPFQEQLKFAREHPGAHFVIGDFEIRCLKPEKYNL